MKMVNFPALCVDNFYDNPDYVRQLALSEEFVKPEGGNFPGSRTKPLHQINEQLFDTFCKKLFSLYYDWEFTPVNWVVETQFQLITPYSDDKNSPKNLSWVHQDAELCLFAGVIYLTPDIELETGTSIYECIDPANINHDSRKSDYWREGIDNDYDIALLKHNACFRETIRFNNVYNRMISFDSRCPHAQTSLYSEKKERLTQVFFVHEVSSESKPPLQRKGYYNNF